MFRHNSHASRCLKKSDNLNWGIGSSVTHLAFWVEATTAYGFSMESACCSVSFISEGCTHVINHAELKVCSSME